ncbi:cation:proton antiporter [Caldimonas sp. KR1-144]|uniref:cation:proton antiporter n=1 Tax=Caldimonas sp. KR1-144 TaxID=3400911 RepID=UPI003C05A86A
MSIAQWSLLVGTLLVAMVLTGSLLERLPLSGAMVYLLLGWLLGPDVGNVLRPDPRQHAVLLEHLAEVALLISLFSVGMQLGVPLRDRRWRLPVRLALVAMAAMVALLAVVGVWGLALPLGAAVLLGAILAPTDPVLASAVRSEPGPVPDRLGFSLAGEGGLNDGTAFPFVLLGLALLGAQPFGFADLQRWIVELVWVTGGGIAIGALLGAATGRLVVHLRSRHGEAVGLDEFLSLGLVGMAYGLAQVSLASGFLAVFAAGMALQRVREAPERALERPAHDRQHASEMRDSVQAFNTQLENLAEMALVLLVGAMLAYAPPVFALWWFVPLVLLVLRPLSVVVALAGEPLSPPQRGMIAWFGIRGIGSVFYLMFALARGLPMPIAELLLSLTLWTVAASIVVHGITSQPLMQRYRRVARVA